MKAIGYQTPGTITRADALQDITLPRPTATGQDLLVRVRAVSVNPVDTKVRRNAAPEPGQWKVLGWDAVGEVVETGPDAAGFAPGDQVYYAGAVTRTGANAEYHLVDARLAALKPARLTDAEAAALPLTAITAWETVFDRLNVARPVPGAAKVILVIGGAGGVGSVAIQLLKAMTDLTVIATASRPETQAWVRAMGADHVVNHRQPLAPQVEALGLGAPAFVFSTTETEQHLTEIASLIAVQGRLALIDDLQGPVDISQFKRKSVSIHWEMMFTRSIFQTDDMGEQGRILAQIARLVDDGQLKTTLTETLRPINAANLKAAHARLESGTAMGKIVLEGF